MRTQQSAGTHLAIIGMGCRFPQANGVDELWDLLVGGVDAVTAVPPERFDIAGCYDPVPGTPGRTVSRHGGFIDDPFGFDAAFFGIAPVEARSMDPQQRVLLHVVWEALEASGIRPSSLAGSRTGVFVGQATAEHADVFRPATGPSVRSVVGSRLRSVTAGRISYALDLRGPSIVLDTACSSSLVAVHAARQSLLTGESDLAIAAGVNIVMSAHDSIAYSQGGMLSSAGRCRFGDADADGFVRSEGVGVVVLKRLPDALRDGDPVLALLLGSAVTNDGSASGLLLQPSVEGQAEMVRQACRSAGIEPAQLDYVEAHGTGTAVGDKVELQALAASAGDRRSPERPLLTGSVKTNIGHTEAAAGIAGLIKAVLMARHRMIPASLHLTRTHPLLSREDFPVRVVTRAQPLGEAARQTFIGVSSFGLAGTNAHVVIGSADRREEDHHTPRTGDGSHLLVLSARSAAALSRLAQAYADWLSRAGCGRAHTLDDICAAAATRRDAHPFRLWAVGDGHDDLAAKLRALAAGETIEDGGIAEAGFAGAKRTVFVFPGQGSQWPGMGRSLLESSPAFRAALDRCDQAVREELGWSVRELLTSETASGEAFPDDVAVVQPALWTMQVALTAALREHGVEPDVCLGHSMGEVAAAHVAGALSLTDAAAVICRRSRLMHGTAGRGAMLVVELSAAQARQAVAGYGGTVCVAAENSPTTTVLAGDREALAELGAALEQQGVLCRPVRVNVASHSPAMEQLREELLGQLAGLAPTRAATAMVSTVRCAPVYGPELDAAYWMDNLRNPVRFTEAVTAAAADGGSVFVEISPHPLLTAAIGDTLAEDASGPATVPTLHRGRAGRTEIARAVGRVFAAGGTVDWQRWYGSGPRRLPPLPTYPWDAVEYRPTGDASSSPHAAPVQVRDIVLARWGARDWGSGVALRGLAPVPPVVYLAAMLEAAQETAEGTMFELRDVELGDVHLPIEAAADTQLRVTLGVPGPGACRSTRVEARPAGAETLVTCATGKVAVADDSDPCDATREVEGALARCHEYRSAQDFQLLAAVRGLDIDEPFQAVEHLWRRDGEAVARMRLPKASAPAAWEVGLQPILAALPAQLCGEGSGGCVPEAFALVQFYAQLPHEFWSICRVTPGGGDRPPRADVLLADPDGRLLARFSGIRLRRLAGLGSAFPLTTAPGLLARLTARCAAPLTGLVASGATPLVTGLTQLLRPVVPAMAAASQVPALRPAVSSAQGPSLVCDSRPQPAAAPREESLDPSAVFLGCSTEILGLRHGALDERRSLHDQGLDSLMATQLSGRLRRLHGIQITAGRLLGPESVASILSSLAELG